MSNPLCVNFPVHTDFLYYMAIIIVRILTTDMLLGSFHELHVCTIQSLCSIRLLLLTICINLLMAITTIWKFDGKTQTAWVITLLSELDE